MHSFFKNKRSVCRQDTLYIRIMADGELIFQVLQLSQLLYNLALILYLVEVVYNLLLHSDDIVLAFVKLYFEMVNNQQ